MKLHRRIQLLPRGAPPSDRRAIACAAAACALSLSAITPQQVGIGGAATPPQGVVGGAMTSPQSVGGGAMTQPQNVVGATAPATAPATTLRDSRVVLGKWIEAQQILSKERNDWQQGREVLGSRIELLRREVLGLQEKVAEARQRVADAQAKKDAETARRRELETTEEQLAGVVAGLEQGLRALFPRLPETVLARVQLLRQRMPDPGVETRASVAERFQNVIGILNELNKANSEIHVTYEVRELADGKPSEVRVIYAGLAQAWYVSANGSAGIGRPPVEGGNGWTWEPSQAIAADVLHSLEILQGKQSPAFVPLPVKLR